MGIWWPSGKNVQPSTSETEIDGDTSTPICINRIWVTVGGFWVHHFVSVQHLYFVPDKATHAGLIRSNHFDSSPRLSHPQATAGSNAPQAILPWQQRCHHRAWVSRMPAGTGRAGMIIPAAAGTMLHCAWHLPQHHTHAIFACRMRAMHSARVLHQRRQQ